MKSKSSQKCQHALHLSDAGLGNPRNGLHPVQARLAKAHGSQCGFCTPGFVMSMYSLLRSKPEAPTESEIEDNLAGNLWFVTYALQTSQSPDMH